MSSFPFNKQILSEDTFVPKSIRLKALGSVNTEKDPLLKKLLQLAEQLFKPKKIHSSSDWLAVRNEKGQTFDQFINSNTRNPVTKQRDTIYIHFLDNKITQDFKDKLVLYCKAFYYGMKVVAIDSKHESFLNHYKIKTRIHYGNLQYNASQILQQTIPMVPKDGYCMISVTTEDIYPDESYNFVFGLASLANRTGVFSFKRYDPEFWGIKDVNRNEILLRNACQVMVHELGHMFWMQHCIYYECVLNGSNSYNEAIKRPGYLCPVCTRKLHAVLKCRAEERCKEMLTISEQLGFQNNVEHYNIILNL